MNLLAAFAAGLLFSIGLVISGMTHPENIVRFLDFFGAWKPDLAFVMVGAVGVYAAFNGLVRKRPAPLFALSFDQPSTKTIDRRLLVGSAAFGIGWGMSGFCPGPALVALGAGATPAFVFVAALGLGIYLHHLAASPPRSGSDSNVCG